MYYLKSEKKNAHVRGATAPPMQLRQISRRATPFRSQTRPQQLHTRCRRRMLPPPYATAVARAFDGCRMHCQPPPRALHAPDSSEFPISSCGRRRHRCRPSFPSSGIAIHSSPALALAAGCGGRRRDSRGHQTRRHNRRPTCRLPPRSRPACAPCGCQRQWLLDTSATALQLSCDRSCARPARSVRRRYPGFRLPDLLGRLMSTSLFSCSSASPLATARVMKIVPALMMPHVASAKLATEAAARGDICGRLRGDGSTARHAPGAREIRNNPATDWDSYRADRSGREFCSWLSRRAAAQARGCELPTSHSKGT